MSRGDLPSTPYEFASLGGQTPDLWMPIAQQPYFVTGSTLLTDPGASSVRMWIRPFREEERRYRDCMASAKLQVSQLRLSTFALACVTIVSAQ